MSDCTCLLIAKSKAKVMIRWDRAWLEDVAQGLAFDHLPDRTGQ